MQQKSAFDSRLGLVSAYRLTKMAAPRPVRLRFCKVAPEASG